jgi:hypothetical protein
MSFASPWSVRTDLARIAIRENQASSLETWMHDHWSRLDQAQRSRVSIDLMRSVANSGSMDCLRVLHAHGCDMMTRLDHGSTVGHHCHVSYALDTWHSLGGNIHAVTDHGDTIGHAVIRSPGSLKTWLAMGGHRDARNHGGLSIGHHAAIHSCHGLGTWIRHGGNVLDGWMQPMKALHDVLSRIQPTYPFEDDAPVFVTTTAVRLMMGRVRKHPPSEWNRWVATPMACDLAHRITPCFHDAVSMAIWISWLPSHMGSS